MKVLEAGHRRITGENDFDVPGAAILVQSEQAKMATDYTSFTRSGATLPREGSSGCLVSSNMTRFGPYRKSDG